MITAFALVDVREQRVEDNDGSLIRGVNAKPPSELKFSTIPI
jgi:hypothetical protein